MTDDIFAPIKTGAIANQRKTIRYISNSNTVTVSIKSIFRSRKCIDTKIINISSKGARISSKYKFSIKTKIIFNLKTKDGTTWKIPAKIACLYSNMEYGITFTSIQHDLIDQIMANDADFTIA